MPADAPDNYWERVEQARDTLHLRRQVELVAADGWGMEPGDTFTIYYADTDSEHVLLHYLAHARMLEYGWKQPVFCHDTPREFLYANRSADAFTDYWAYRLVADEFGADHLLAYTAWLVDTAPEQLVQELETRGEQDDAGFARRCTVFAVDWFGMAPVLLQQHDERRAAQLEELFTTLQATRFGSRAPDDVAERVARVRDLFQDLGGANPTFGDLLETGQETAFHRYYGTVWPAEPPATIDGFKLLAAFTADPA